MQYLKKIYNKLLYKKENSTDLGKELMVGRDGEEGIDWELRTDICTAVFKMDNE